MALLAKLLELDLQNIPRYPVLVVECEAELQHDGDVKVTGRVVNTSEARMPTPWLHVTVRDRHGMLLREETVYAGLNFLQAREAAVLDVLMPDCESSAHTVTIVVTKG